MAPNSTASRVRPTNKGLTIARHTLQRACIAGCGGHEIGSVTRSAHGGSPSGDEVESAGVGLGDGGAEGLVMGGGEGGVFTDDGEGVAAGHAEQLEVFDQVGHLQLRQAVLAGAEELPGAAELEVFLGDAEPVGRFAQRLQPAKGQRAAGVGNEDAVGVVGPPPDSPAELVELGEAEAVGMGDDHDVGVGHVDAHLDDHAGHQGVDLAGGETPHHLVLFALGHLPVQQVHAEVPQAVAAEVFAGVHRGGQLAVVGGVDHRVDEVRLLPGGESLAKELEHLGHLSRRWSRRPGRRRPSAPAYAGWAWPSSPGSAGRGPCRGCRCAGRRRTCAARRPPPGPTA